jgi:hypothetical protein
MHNVMPRLSSAKRKYNKAATERARSKKSLRMQNSKQAIKPWLDENRDI